MDREQHVTDSTSGLRLAVSTLATTLVVVTVMAYVLYTGQRLTAVYAPLLDAATETKVEAGQACLALEETLSGDGDQGNDVSIGSHLVQAERHVKTLLQASQPGHGPVLLDPGMHREALAIGDRLIVLRRLAQERLAAGDAPPAQEDLRARMDTAFHRLVTHADQVKSMLQGTMTIELSRYRLTSTGITAFTLLAGVLVSLLLYRYGERRREDYIAVQHATKMVQDQNTALDYLAHFDGLTQLPNRTLFFDRLGQVLAHANRRDEWAALMFLDLDGFKNINDSLGHSQGDALLEVTAQRLTGIMREEDTIARLGGDEFTVLLPYQLSRSEAMRSASMVAEKILRAFREPVALDAHDTRVTCSIGISLYPQDARNPDDLLRHADTAMYHAKKTGRNNYQFFSEDMNTVIRHRVIVEAGLRRAMDRDELRLYYQPLLDLATGDIVGAEALVRWQHPERGLLLPNRFIQVAEETGVVVPLGEWVLERAARQFLVWRGTGQAMQHMIVNLCPVQFRHREMLDVIEQTVSNYRLATGALQVDIAESTLMKDTDYSMRALHSLRDAGASLAIDDFGTGYSSIAYLRRFPVDTLKIHQSFVADTGADTAGQAVVTAMIRFAHSLGFQVIAEGVEAEEQSVFLAEQGCNRAQGNLFGPAMPAEDFTRLLQPDHSLELSDA